jgi:hypothetical protein
VYTFFSLNINGIKYLFLQLEGKLSIIQMTNAHYKLLPFNLHYKVFTVYFLSASFKHDHLLTFKSSACLSCSFPACLHLIPNLLTRPAACGVLSPAYPAYYCYLYGYFFAELGTKSLFHYFLPLLVVRYSKSLVVNVILVLEARVTM